MLTLMLLIWFGCACCAFGALGFYRLGMQSRVVQVVLVTDDQNPVPVRFVNGYALVGTARAK